MFKAVQPKKQRHYRPRGVGSYVRITPRLFYISSEACKEWGEHERCNISIDAPHNVMVLTPYQGGDWKLSSVCETKYAKRIETRNSTISFLEAGFPKGMLGKYLECHVDMVGSLVVSLVPDYDKIRSA